MPPDTELTVLTMNTHTISSLAGYTLVESLYKGSRTEVYKALQTEPQQPVVIKVLRHQHPSFAELVQFRNQYAIARHLNHPAIVCPLALERCGNGYALVMPDEGFISLGTYAQQQPLDLSTVLAIAIQLTDALHYLISQRIIHKDIKPGNILIHPETRQIKLIDFSIASLLHRLPIKQRSPILLLVLIYYQITLGRVITPSPWHSIKRLQKQAISIPILSRWNSGLKLF